MIIYDIQTGFPIYDIGKDQIPEIFLYHKANKENYGWIKNSKGSDWEKYKIVDGEQILIPPIELIEYMKYGRILTDEERMIESIKPSQEEIDKAIKQLEFLEFMEVFNSD